MRSSHPSFSSKPKQRSLMNVKGPKAGQSKELKVGAADVDEAAPMVG
jgi:hypothetical protein